MYLARLNTPNFEFLILEDKKEEALELMRKAWNKHQRDTGANWDWNFISDSVFITFIRCGDVLKNEELIASYDTPEMASWLNN